jgi:transcriptional regulator with XRE-family HTH domain
MRTHHTPAGMRIDLDGAKLRELRLSLGMTLAEVATIVGCSFAAIGHYEREAMIPGQDAINGLRRVFGDALESTGALVTTSWVENEIRHLDQRFKERMDDPDAE